MDFVSYEDKEDDFFFQLNSEIPNQNFCPDIEEETQEDKDSFLPDPKPIQSIFSETNLFERLISSESHRTTQTGESIFSENSFPSFKEGSEKQADPICKNSHKIAKPKEKKPPGKGKIAKITEENVLSGDIPLKYIPEEFNQPNLDEKTKKKILQTIRNRVAAQNSRDKKKHLLSEFEVQNNILIQENIQLKNYIKRLEEINASLTLENQQYKAALEGSQLLRTNKNSLSEVMRPEEGFFEEDMINKDRSMPFSESDMMNSTESSNPSGPGTPVMRKSSRSGGFMKFSFAVIAIMALIMYNGINSPNQTINSTALSTVPDRNSFKTNPSKLYFSQGRILQEDDKDDVPHIMRKTSDRPQNMQNQSSASIPLENYNSVHHSKMKQQSSSGDQHTEHIIRNKMVEENDLAKESNVASNQNVCIGDPDNEKLNPGTAPKELKLEEKKLAVENKDIGRVYLAANSEL